MAQATTLQDLVVGCVEGLGHVEKLVCGLYNSTQDIFVHHYNRRFVSDVNLCNLPPTRRGPGVANLLCTGLFTAFFSLYNIKMHNSLLCSRKKEYFWKKFHVVPNFLYICYFVLHIKIKIICCVTFFLESRKDRNENLFHNNS